MRPSDPSPNPVNLAFVEELFAQYQSDPASVSAEWQRYFAALPAGEARLGPSFEPTSIFNPPSDGVAGAPADAPMQERIDMLVRSYRVRGHMIAKLDPLGLARADFPELDPAFYGFGPADMDRPFSARAFGGQATLTLREIVQKLKNTYCRSIGVQFMHIDNLQKKNWLQERMELSENRIVLSKREQLRILRRLTDAVMFEEFIQKKFLGSKSFSLEGSESLIPLLDLTLERAAEQGVDDAVFGMAHRGRLNVLTNILGKAPGRIFKEFADTEPEKYRGRGDVKYHLGHTSVFETSSGAKVNLSLCFNPSHLEFVNPVALGRVRARGDRAGDAMRRKSLSILIHGDASFAGQGVVFESLNLSELKGYTTGGALHVIVNNQIGFTTDPHDSRSSTYCTDVAKMLQIPIFHVNGEDPEAVAQVVNLALDFRQEFQTDVVIDMYGYRRRGHNEGDEPAFTQPVLYKAIRERKPVREGYLDHLLALGGVQREEADAIAEETRVRLEAELDSARNNGLKPAKDSLGTAWEGLGGGRDASVPELKAQNDSRRLGELLLATTKTPGGFAPHPTIERWLETRAKMASGEKPLDWGAGEALAFATLAVDGHRVRVTGQDCERGTFSHRHSVLHDVKTGAEHMPMAHLSPSQAPIEIINSPLSETAVLGFEYGYSLDWPDGLVIWEAQFGDFNNVAQVIVDQFLVSAEEKWQRLSGLVMLLPHGFEGQGPEHSSARLERFLQLCAEDNIQVVNLTTPAQIYHCLRRQVLRPWRKPLIVMSPKSLLRHPRAVSSLGELANGSFQRIIPDQWKGERKSVERVLLCSGKVYYELEEEREKRNRGDVAILRVEQLYPLTTEALQAALAPYGAKTPVVWVQEEPENMGAWRHMLVHHGLELQKTRGFSGVCRPAAASPATGSPGAHKLEQQELLERAFAKLS